MKLLELNMRSRKSKLLPLLKLCNGYLKYECKILLFMFDIFITKLLNLYLISRVCIASVSLYCQLPDNGTETSY